MRIGLFALMVSLGLAWTASSALAGEADGSRPLTRESVETWTPCETGKDYARAYAPNLAQAPRKQWRGAVAAYVWATDISGTSYADGQPTDIDVEFSDLFDKLESAFMGYAEVGYDRWSLAVDASLVSLEESWVGLRGVPVDVQVDQTIVDLRLGFQVLCRQVGSSQWGSCCHPRRLTLDAVVGARYWNLEQELSTTLPILGGSLKLSDDESWWDPYVGARLRWPFAKRWGFSLYADVGGFDIGDASRLTWQVQTYLRFHITRGLFVGLGYRVLDVDRVEGSGATRNGIDATYHGPVLGLGFVF